MKQSKMLVLTLIAMVGVTGCGIQNDKEKDNTKTPENSLTDISATIAGETEVIKAGDSVVYLDEVRYYVYNTQATYETYYMAENKELDWKEEKSEGVSLEEAVKSVVLDKICEREAMVSYAREYNVSLNETDIGKVSDKVEKFFSESDDNFKEKVDVSHNRMKEIFEKAALCEKVKRDMNKENEGKSDEMYKNWKKANNVTTNEYWDAINFDTPIFVSNQTY